MKFTTVIENSAFALLLALPLALTACGDGDDEAGAEEASDTSGDGDGDADADAEVGDGDGDTNGDGDGDGETGMLRLMHLGVFPGDANTTVDIYVNGAPAGISFDFKQGTDYVELPVGAYDFDIVPGGGTIDDSVLTIEGFAIANGAMWEVIAAGYIAPEPGDAGFGVIAFPEDADGIAAGQTRLNVFHVGALGALSPVDVWAVDDDCEPVAPLIPGFEFGDVAANFDIPNGPVNVGLDVGQDATVDACFKIPALGDGVMVNAFAVNDDAGNVSLIAHLPDGSTVELTPE